MEKYVAFNHVYEARWFGRHFIYLVLHPVILAPLRPVVGDSREDVDFEVHVWVSKLLDD